MKIVGKTDRGLVRSSNQDSYAAGELPGGMAWAVVCDGMGGTNGGEIASSIAVKSISDQIVSSWRESMSGRSIKNMMESAIYTANVNIYDMSKANDMLRGMGTTVVAAVVADGVAYVSHVGDSRAYFINKNEIIQLTRDHSYVQDMIEKGEITSSEAKQHPQKHFITRALGVARNVAIDHCQADMDAGDVILMCTDGLSNYLESEEIFDLTEHNETYIVADMLIKNANLKGGGDNITVVAIEM